MSTFTAFEGTRLVASGPLEELALKIKNRTVLVFDDATGGQVDIDTSGSDEDILKRLKKQSAPRGPGRPKLGVAAREVTLLPRHWEWLNEQPGGASAAIRKLVEDARKSSGGKNARRAAQNAAYRFMAAMAGNEPDYEEAVRALFAGRKRDMWGLIDPWPGQVRDHIKRLATPAFAEPE